VLACWRAIQRDFNAGQSGGKRISLADLIVLGGCAAVEAAAKKAGTRSGALRSGPHRCERRNRPTCDSFEVLEPKADGFRNYARAGQVQRRPTCWSTRRSC
jgi:catalase-peroxidase